MTVGYIGKVPGYDREGRTYWYVGAKDTSYDGPSASVEYDGKWLHVTTDDYEGHAMLNIEALPALRLALARLARERRRRGEPVLPPIREVQP